MHTTMKSNWKIRSLPLIATVALTGCDLPLDSWFNDIEGSGFVTEETRSLRTFSAVEFGAPGTLLLERGSRNSVWIEGEDNLIDNLDISVSGGTLQIRERSGATLRPTRPLTFRVTTTGGAERLEVSGSGTLRAPYLDADRLHATVGGSGAIELNDVQANWLRTTISTTGRFEATGEVRGQEITLSGSGRFLGRDLYTLTTDITLAGSGTATVRARDRLNAAISGSGSVRYYGSPTVTQSITGGGRLERWGS